MNVEAFEIIIQLSLTNSILKLTEISTQSQNYFRSSLVEMIISVKVYRNNAREI